MGGRGECIEYAIAPLHRISFLVARLQLSFAACLTFVSFDEFRRGAHVVHVSGIHARSQSLVRHLVLIDARFAEIVHRSAVTDQLLARQCETLRVRDFDFFQSRTRRLEGTHRDSAFLSNDEEFVRRERRYDASPIVDFHVVGMVGFPNELRVFTRQPNRIGLALRLKCRRILTRLNQLIPRQLLLLAAFRHGH